VLLRKIKGFFISCKNATAAVKFYRIGPCSIQSVGVSLNERRFSNAGVADLESIS
jgi:hypothetical protein